MALDILVARSLYVPRDISLLRSVLMTRVELTCQTSDGDWFVNGLGWLGNLGYCLELNISSSFTSSFPIPLVCSSIGNLKGCMRCLMCCHFGSYFIEPWTVINSSIWPITSAVVSPQFACSSDGVGHFGWFDGCGMMGIAYKYSWIALKSHFINHKLSKFQIYSSPAHGRGCFRRSSSSHPFGGKSSALLYFDLSMVFTFAHLELSFLVLIIQL